MAAFRFAFSVLVGLASVAEARPRGPSFSSPAPDAEVLVGQTLVVKLRALPGAKFYKCKLRQGDVELDSDSDGEKGPVCRFSDLKDQTLALQPGPAEVTAAAFIDDDYTANTVLSVVLKRGGPKGGAGTKWDGTYWHGGGKGYGKLTCEGATIKNGIMTLPIVVEHTSFGSVRAIVEKDGQIVPQTFTLPKGTHLGKAKVFDEEAIEAAATTSVTVSGRHDVTFKERYFEIRIDGAKPDDGEQRYCEARLFKDGDGWDKSTMPDCPSVPQCGLYADCCPDNPRR